MLDLYTWHTPNGRKAPILLAELDLDYDLHLVDLSKGEQKQEELLAINPNGKIPALVDRDGPGEQRITIFESGAILEYLATRSARFLPIDAKHRSVVMSWLFWQVGGVGPMFGQVEAFGSAEEPKNEAALTKFKDESKRLVGVLDRRLRDRQFIADEYSIADIACYPWFAVLEESFADVLEGSSEVKRWMERMAARPAVQKGMKLTR